ncbi:exonuclease domain-containing protein [Paracoccaceae bacterium]|nr:exonuclease domain-containing protein [Paracoccaceae bacterium]
MRRAIFFDTETTGLSRKTDRLVQIAWILVDLSDNSELNRGSHLIRPDGFEIPYRATEKHGIDTKLAMNKGEPLGSVLNLFNSDLQRADILVGHNIPFDINMISAEFKRFGYSTELLKKPSVCTMRLSTNWCRLPKFNGGQGFKWPSLQELYFRLFGEEFINAHDALADILATKKCFDELVKMEVIVIPTDEFDFTIELDKTEKVSHKELGQIKSKSVPKFAAPSMDEIFKGSKFDTDVLRRAIEAGTDFNKVYHEGWLLLQWAFWFNEIDNATLLIQNGADVAARGRDGTTVLHQCSNERIFPKLIDLSPTVDPRSLFGSTPLHHHCLFGHSEIIEILLDHGASINARCPNGRRVLDIINAGEMTDPEIIEEHVNSAQVSQNLGATALHFLDGYGYHFEHNLTILLEEGLNIDCTDEHGHTPFIYSVLENNIEQVQVLVDYGANASVIDISGNNLFHLMAKEDLERNIPSVAKYKNVVQMDVLLNSENDEGLTPLQCLCSNPTLVSNMNLIEKFIDAGADPYLETKSGETPWDTISRNPSLYGSDIYWNLHQKRFKL